MVDLNISDEGFLESISNNDFEAVNAALLSKPSLVHINSRRTTPLVLAVKKKNVEIVKLLLEYNANVDKQEPNKFQETPLFHAITQKDDDILDILLKTADVNKKIGVNGKGALHHAVYMGNETAVQKIVKHPNVLRTLQDSEGNTPLHIAVDEDNVNMVFKIAGNLRKADLNIKNRNGLIPADVNTSGSADARQALKIVTSFMDYNRRSLAEQQSMIELHRAPHPHVPMHSLTMGHEPTCTISPVDDDDCTCDTLDAYDNANNNTFNENDLTRDKNPYRNKGNLKVRYDTIEHGSKNSLPSSPDEYYTPRSESQASRFAFPKIQQDSAPSLCGDITYLSVNTNICQERTNVPMLLSGEDDVHCPIRKISKSLSGLTEVPSSSMPNIFDKDMVDTTRTSTPKKGSGLVDVPSPSTPILHHDRDEVDTCAMERLHIDLPTHITASNLVTTDLNRLETCLQRKDSSGCPYWELLGMKLHDCNDIALDKYTIELWKTPGGSRVGESIINILHTIKPLFKVEEFIVIAEGCDRYDIRELLKGYKDDLLKDLPFLVIKDLKTLCSLQDITRDWKRLAEGCEFDNDTINKIEGNQYEQKMISPVKQMFLYIKQTYPNLSLSCIVEKLYPFNTTAAETLITIIKEKVAKTESK